jgi:squalene synthase HpnC
MSSDSVLKACEKQCRNLAKGHYENFVVASILLPKRMRQPFYNIYAFCRTADDIADESPSTEIAIERLVDFQSQLDATFDGRPPENLFLPLAHTIEQFGISKQPFDDLLSAFRQDQRQLRYESMDDLLDYCTRSANPVGRILLHLADCTDHVSLQLSDQICTGLQLVNFWQDVARDYAIDRVYLPTNELQQHGLDEYCLTQPSASGPLRELIAKQCDRAEQCFRRGLPLADRVPRWFASDVKLFAHGGLATIAKIRSVDHDVLSIRPKVSKTQQVWLVARAAVGLL